MNTRIVNALTAAVALLVMLIGTGAFTLSYDALYATGAAHGIPTGKAWIWPLLIDGPLVVFTVALLVSQIMRSSAKLWAGLVILYTLATVGFNLSHAQPSPLGWTVAIVAPVGLLLTTEALRHLARNIIERAAAVQALAELTTQAATTAADLDSLNRQKERTQAELDALVTELKAGKVQQKAATVEEMNAARAAKIEARRGQVLDLLGQQVSQEEISNRLGVSVRTIRNDIRQLNGKVEVTQ